MNTKIVMSFIIPVYNNPVKELNRCINSIIKIQKIRYEILIIDNGSNENRSIEYRELVNDFDDKRIHYIYTSKNGVSNARNIGIDHARGRFVTFVDADDIIVADCYSSLQIDEHVDLYILNVIIKNTKSKRLLKIECRNPNNVTEQELLQNITSSFNLNNVWGKIFKLSFLKKYNLRFNSKLQLGEDVTFMSEVILKKPATIYINRISYIYFQTVKNSTNRVVTMPLRIYENTKYLFKLKMKLQNKLDPSNGQISNYIFQEYIKGLADNLFELWNIHNEESNLVKQNIFNDFKQLKLNRNFSTKINIIIWIIKNQKCIGLYVFLKKSYLKRFKR